ncbi:MAG: metalloregulator ArsR/SmtB family transcription factor [Phycisphaerales bacterium]|jgi:ArsR family transcriptional regulator
MNEEEIVNIYKALSVKSRLQILKLIKDKELCVNAITARLEISQPAVSQHLSILKKAGLVKSSRYGSIVHYKMDKSRLDNFKKSVKKHFGDEFI